MINLLLNIIWLWISLILELEVGLHLQMKNKWLIISRKSRKKPRELLKWKILWMALGNGRIKFLWGFFLETYIRKMHFCWFATCSLSEMENIWLWHGIGSFLNFRTFGRIFCLEVPSWPSSCTYRTFYGFLGWVDRMRPSTARVSVC